MKKDSDAFFLKGYFVGIQVHDSVNLEMMDFSLLNSWNIVCLLLKLLVVCPQWNRRILLASSVRTSETKHNWNQGKKDKGLWVSRTG